MSATDGTPSPFRPFCSQRCKLADLGSWLSGDYRISRPVAEEDLDQGPPSPLDAPDDTHGGSDAAAVDEPERILRGGRAPQRARGAGGKSN